MGASRAPVPTHDRLALSEQNLEARDALCMHAYVVDGECHLTGVQCVRRQCCAVLPAGVVTPRR